MRGRVPAGSFDRICSWSTLWRAWVEYRRGKRRRPAIADFDIDADRRLFSLERQLRNGVWAPGPRVTYVRREPKPRVIVVAPVIDRVLEHALIGELAPWYERSFLDQSYACRTGRGPLRAVMQAWRWSRTYRWCLHLDIRGYFAHIDHRVLRQLYAKRLRDPGTLSLLDLIFAAGGAGYQTLIARRIGRLPQDHPPHCGLPVGSLVSHFSGALYLDGADHYVKRTLKVPAYLRYMDDLLLFADDRYQLEQWRGFLSQWLAAERGLALNETPEGVIRPHAGFTFLGYRVHPNGLHSGPVVRRRARWKLRRALRAGPESFERTITSYRAVWRFG